jgi:hypothetical protein
MITRRVYVDSRHAVSGNSGNFLIGLEDQLVLPPSSVLYITDISLPHSFYTVDYTNRNIHIIEAQGGTNTARTIQLPMQNYDTITLRPAVEVALNGASKSVAGTYSVGYNPEKGNYTILLSGGGTYRWMTEYNLGLFDGRSDFITAGGTQISPWNGADDLLGMRTKTLHLQVTILDTGHIDIRNLHQLFLHSSTLTSYNTMGPNGVRGCLCRIPVTSQFGDMIWKQHSGLLHDYVNCGGVNASALQFSLRDSFNKEVNLNAGGLSFTVLFTEQPVI